MLCSVRRLSRLWERKKKKNNKPISLPFLYWIDQNSRKGLVDAEKGIYSIARLRGDRNLKNKVEVAAAVEYR